MILCNASKSAKSSESFSFLIDLKEMPIDEYNRQLLSESKSTQMGNPAWMICKNAMLWPCCSLFSFKVLYYLSKRFYFLSKRFYILDTCVIFLRFFHSTFITFHSAFILFHSAFYFLAKFFCSSFSKCKKALLFKFF